MPNKTVLAFGEILWDLLPAGAQLGGAPFNFAYRINSLGHQGLIVSRLGRDELGNQAWNRVHELGMDCRFIQWDEQAPTGTVQIQLIGHNPDFFIVPNVAYVRIEKNEELLNAAAQADAVCFGTLIQRNPISRRTLYQTLNTAKKALKILDINLRKNCYTTETITASLEPADILKLNEDEAKYLGKLYSIPVDSLPRLCQVFVQQWSLTQCVITLGERGVLAVDAKGQQVYAPGFKVNVVDTCGSGDAFTAGFLDQLFQNHSLEECCRFGNACGALVASQHGATTPIRKDEIIHFLAQKQEQHADSNFVP